MEKTYTQMQEQKRKEIEFAHMLETITGFEWKKQVCVCNGKYRIDFLLGTELIVEYDEKYHETKEQKRKDAQRIKEIREWFKENVFYDDWDIPVIRVKEGLEYEGIREVIDHLVAYEILSCWNYEARREEVESIF